MQTTPIIRLAVFDLDGTLVDSRRDLATAANALIAERGGAPLSEEAVGGMVGEGAGVLVRRALAAAGLDPAVPDALPRFLELYDDHLVETTRPYDGIVEMLGALRPRVPMAVLTNKPQKATDRMLRELALASYFRMVVGGDTPLGRKPDPAGLLSIARSMGAGPADTILIGDSPIDVATARNAGTRVCVAGYGFGYRAGDTAVPVVTSPAAILGQVTGDQRS